MEGQERKLGILRALGDGGTMEMAENVMVHLAMTRNGIPIEDIGGLSEVARMLGRHKNTVCNWISRGTYSTPEPIATLAATKLYDLAQWRVWSLGHPELTNSYAPGVSDGD